MKCLEMCHVVAFQAIVKESGGGAKCRGRCEGLRGGCDPLSVDGDGLSGNCDVPVAVGTDSRAMTILSVTSVTSPVAVATVFVEVAIFSVSLFAPKLPRLVANLFPKWFAEKGCATICLGGASWRGDLRFVRLGSVPTEKNRVFLIGLPDLETEFRRQVRSQSGDWERGTARRREYFRRR